MRMGLSGKAQASVCSFDKDVLAEGKLTKAS